MSNADLIASLRLYGRHDAADALEAAEAQLKMVLDRESATAARHDAKVEKLEARAERAEADLKVAQVWHEKAQDFLRQMREAEALAERAEAEVARLREVEEGLDWHAEFTAIKARAEAAEAENARWKAEERQIRELLRQERNRTDELEAEARGMERAAKLWALLDDIDTVSDIAKSDDAAYRATVERIQRKRFEIMTGEEYDAALREAEARGMERDGWGGLLAEARAEAEKAMHKFPQPNYVISKIAEEAGEVVKAAIHCAEGREAVEAVRGEMKQLIAMLYRLWVEGDGVHGLPAIRAEKERTP